MAIGAISTGSGILGALGGNFLLAPKSELGCRLALDRPVFGWSDLSQCQNGLGFSSAGVLLNPEARVFICGAVALIATAILAVVTRKQQ
jgi:hypothetical protein